MAFHIARAGAREAPFLMASLLMISASITFRNESVRTFRRARFPSRYINRYHGSSHCEETTLRAPGIILPLLLSNFEPVTRNGSGSRPAKVTER